MARSKILASFEEAVRDVLSHRAEWEDVTAS